MALNPQRSLQSPSLNTEEISATPVHSAATPSNRRASRSSSSSQRDGRPLAHTHLLGAHLGVEKTLERIKTRFYWPGVKKAVEDYCRSCPDCQQVAPRPHQKSPLIPLPIISVPFSRIGMDLVGPLHRSSRGHQYILVVLDYATRYPEAIPLRTMATKGIARELMLLFSRVGLPEEILTDQGTPFMSRIMRDLCQLMKVTQLRTSFYHPQTDGLVERFNQTLKKMLKKTMEADGRNWDQLLPYVLFAIREVPQVSTGFSPFELLYGRRPRGLLDLAKEAWEQQPSPHRTMVEHVEEVKKRMATIWPMVREHMAEAQTAQARVYNRGAQPREFAPGDKVLVLVPTSECKFLAKWNGPYEVMEKVGTVNYRVRQPGRRPPTKVYHVNLLKKWVTREVLFSINSPQIAVKTEPVEVQMGEQLTPSQRQDLQDLVNRNRDVFSTEAGHTDLIQHQIVTEPGKRVKLRPYRIPEARREAIAAEEVDSWEIIEGLKIGQTSVQRPDKYEGFMLKKRKWPLKGWHKRFFILDNGILKYSKSPVNIQKGKMHGSIDVGLSVMSIKKRACRIDLDTEEHIYHLKVKSHEVFDAWVCKLRHHRLYRQNEIVRSPRDATLPAFPPVANTEPPKPGPPTTTATEPQTTPSNLAWQTLQSSASQPTSYSSGQRKVGAWLQESQEMDRCAEELTCCQSNLMELNQLMQSLEIMQRTQSAPNFAAMQGNCVDMSKKDKHMSRRWRTKSLSKDAKMHLQVPPSATLSPQRHSSIPNLYADMVDFQTPGAHLGDSLEGTTGYIKLQEDFCVIAHKVHSLLKSAFNTVATEKEKLTQLLSEQEQAGQAAQILSLKRSLHQSLTQNAELRTRLNRIHSASGLSEQMICVNIIPSADEASDQVGIPRYQQVSESRVSMSESASEFFDAQEVLLSASSSENEASEDESYVSDVSDNISEDNASFTDNISRQSTHRRCELEWPQVQSAAFNQCGTPASVDAISLAANGNLTGGAFRNGQRTGLPAPSPDASNINLWNILRNNIGKNLSKLAQAVELNESLNTLQHLCKELEYVELLDNAAETDDPYERMMWFFKMSSHPHIHPPTTELEVSHSTPCLERHMNVYEKTRDCAFSLNRQVIDANQRARWVSNNSYRELRKSPHFNKL
ncbi:hypothetical protein SKAU_G00249870 [Synaphobranchus kaupii]|uniref:Gypsy retrotransposon integrase-like protein 1 n=1 Tax=Synaphobranchus kaupii TaxID=118154 RepID=A0A9Q1F2L0_SYNKA|nr:hypothetical protein SKAU_G00249870 [Synaphobranchus kaupii]